MSSPDVIAFTSPFDQTEQRALLSRPASYRGEPLPLILAPHPCTWTAENDFSGGGEGVKVVHDGWRGVADRYNVLIVQPFGHGRVSAVACLAYEGQIQDLAAMPDILAARGHAVDRQRLYACGLSMGGQETAVLAGRNPGLLAAAFAFNAVLDLAAWHEDMATSPHDAIREERIDLLIEEEVGGSPMQVPEEYAKRSAFSYVQGLTQTPLMLYWSQHDAIVTRAATKQSKHLYDRIKAADPLAPVAEYNHTWDHGYTQFDLDTCWALHEYSDYDLAARWLLTHRKAT